MDEWMIDEAANLELACGTKFGTSSEGKVIIGMARKYLALIGDPLLRPQAPCKTVIARKEDMSVNGCLRLFRQEDGDICVAVIADNGDTAGVEFCSVGMGGGRSPNTL
jgi:hypothetical protein